MSASPSAPILPADAQRCAAIFRDAIELSAGDDYDEDQRAAWAAKPTTRRRSARAWRKLPRRDDGRLRRRLRQPEGRRRCSTCSMSTRSRPAGRGRALVDAMARLAAARGAKRLTAEASDSVKAPVRPARLLAERRSLVQIGDMARPHQHDEDARTQAASAQKPDTDEKTMPANASISSTRRCATAR